MITPVIVDKNETKNCHYLLLSMTSSYKLVGFTGVVKRTVYTNVWVINQDRRVYLKNGVNYTHAINTIRYYCRKGYPALIITDCFNYYK